VTAVNLARRSATTRWKSRVQRRGRRSGAARVRGALGQLSNDTLGTCVARVKRLKVGTARRLSATTEKSLVADLGTILDPQYVARAREVATRMTKPAESVVTAADLLENFARLKRVG
jgi:hypothetical protein